MFDDELVSLKDVVSSWFLQEGLLLSSRISLQRPANCRDRGKVTALFGRANSSDVNELLDEFSISWSDILLWAPAIKLSVSMLPSLVSFCAYTNSIGSEKQR